MIDRKTVIFTASVALFSSQIALAEISTCRFNIGVDLTQASTKKCGYLGCTKNLADLDIPTGIDFVMKFTGHTDVGGGRITPAPQSLQEGTFLKWAKELNVTPMYKTYIIAEGMKVAFDLDKDQSDCNGSASKTICTEAGAYFAQHRSDILDQYTDFAKDAATRWGTTKPMIWALEPDFYQYASSANGNRNPLSFGDAAKLIGDIADVIKAQMPNAQISMDVSPWAPESWFTSLPLSKFTYMNTSGGISQPYANIKGNELSWARLKQLTNLPIIADDGYGAGGGLTSPNTAWTDIGNIKARMNDGVIGLMEAYPTSSWTSTIATIHTQSAKTSCNDAKFALSVTAGPGGSVSINPAKTSFDSGATVQLTAVPSAGYKFSAWGGSASGSVNPLTVTMDAAKTISATFVADNTPELTIGTAANGSVVVAPVMPADGYEKGTLVTVTATPAAGYQLVAWTGSVTGNTNPLSLKMDSGMTITPIFRKIGEVTNLVKGGDGASTTNWTVVSNPSGAALTTAADPKSSANTVLSTKGNYGEKSGEEAFMVTQGGIQVTAGTTYFLSFRAMVSSPDDARGAHPLGVKFENGSTVAFKVSDSVKQDTSWHDYSFSFKATATGTATLSFLLGNGGDRNWQSVLIDDVVLSDAPPVPVVARNVVRRIAMKVVGGSLDLAFVAEQGDLRIDAVSPSGEVRNLVDRRVEAGSFRTAVPVSDLRNGVYTLMIRNGNNLRTGAFSVVK